MSATQATYHRSSFTNSKFKKGTIIKVLLKRFHLIGTTIRFNSQSQKLELIVNKYSKSSIKSGHFRDLPKCPLSRGL